MAADRKIAPQPYYKSWAGFWGGYRFVHLTLRDHIAQIDPETFQLD